MVVTVVVIVQREEDLEECAWEEEVVVVQGLQQGLVDLVADERTGRGGETSINTTLQKHACVYIDFDRRGDNPGPAGAPDRTWLGTSLRSCSPFLLSQKWG